MTTSLTRQKLQQIIKEEISLMREGLSGRRFFYVTVSGQEMGELDDGQSAPEDLFRITMPVTEMIVGEILDAAKKANALAEHSGIQMSRESVIGLHLLGQGVAVEPPYAESPYDPVDKNIYVYSNKPGRL